MLAGVMPTRAWPGVMMPGQFGPMIRVLLPLDSLYAQAYALSCTGIPSVMTTSSGISASMASMIASLAYTGGTKMIDTSAPVFSMASFTLPNTGNSTGSSLTFLCATVVPALRALTPPTMWVPALSIRAVCLVASEPVMPWTTTLLSLVKKIAMWCSVLFSGARQLGGLVGGLVHRGHQGHQRVVGLGQNPAAFVDVVAVEPHDERLVGVAAQDLQGLDDAGGNGVTRGDAAEDVDEHALDLLVAQHDVQPRGHHLSRGATADVEEVGRLH